MVCVPQSEAAGGLLRRAVRLGTAPLTRNRRPLPAPRRRLTPPAGPKGVSHARMQSETCIKPSIFAHAQGRRQARLWRRAQGDRGRPGQRQVRRRELRPRAGEGGAGAGRRGCWLSNTQWELACENTSGRLVQQTAHGKRLDPTPANQPNPLCVPPPGPPGLARIGHLRQGHRHRGQQRRDDALRAGERARRQRGPRRGQVGGGRAGGFAAAWREQPAAGRRSRGKFFLETSHQTINPPTHPPTRPHPKGPSWSPSRPSTPGSATPTSGRWPGWWPSSRWGVSPLGGGSVRLAQQDPLVPP